MSDRALAYHLIISAYGFWLPNDPRGSWSSYVRSHELYRFGPATKVDTHRSVARAPHNHKLRHDAKESLARPAVRFNGIQARAMARGFADYTRRSGCLIHACAIMPDHCHLIVADLRCSVEQAIRLLKGAATRQLTMESTHPFAAMPTSRGVIPSPFARHGWSVFLHRVEVVLRSIRYVEENPIRAGLRAQRWRFVTPFRAGEPSARPL